MSTLWDPELDAVIAAPEHHRLAFENDRVRVLETKIGPGEKVNLHTHEWPAAYYMFSYSHFVRRNAKGEVVLDTREQCIVRQPGEALWAEPIEPHTLENVGETTLHLVSVEIKPH